MIHQSGNALEDHDRKALEERSPSEEDKILRLMRVRKSEAFAAWEMANIYMIPEGNARRALSNLSGSDSSLRDHYGNFPLTKRTELRRKNPRTGKSNVTYQYNINYGVKPARPTGQLSILDDVRCGV